ncbi:uncharacterized protein LOC118202848 isoform X2 [Stegodyphus dumicola]|uniref:uncharacterized protein LOC118202848 isoform X2 n=1 Tax=Stegodyphus dumicola TaxID=202533 RepID=UPI0015B15A89|nr:uncharacterized protein LOC118202848 isoform X2 [Stegodyphus dumicola]
MDEEIIYDLCIIGAGMFGSAAARHASANVPLRVCLVGPDEPTEKERQQREIFSSHYDEGRITRILDDDPACQILSRHSISRYRELEELSGIHFHYPVGFLYIGTRNSQIMNKMVQVAATCDVPTVDLHRDEIFQMSSMPSIVCRRDLENTGLNLGAYILPPIRYPDGNYYLKIGHMDMVNCDIKTLPEVKHWYLSKGDERVIEMYSKLLIEMLPGLEVEGLSSMTCVTCESPSGLPYIDQVSPTVTVAVVGNGKGAKFSDEVGRIAAHLSITGKWDSELAKSQFKVILAES